MAKTKKHAVKKQSVRKVAAKPWWLGQVSLPFAVVVMLLASFAVLAVINEAYHPVALEGLFNSGVGTVAGASTMR